MIVCHIPLIFIIIFLIITIFIIIKLMFKSIRKTNFKVYFIYYTFKLFKTDKNKNKIHTHNNVP